MRIELRRTDYRADGILRSARFIKYGRVEVIAMAMQHAHLSLKLKGESPTDAQMCWRRSALGPTAGFELLGRAFEVTQRETDAALAEALRAFFHGAMLHKGDIAAVLEGME